MNQTVTPSRSCHADGRIELREPLDGSQEVHIGIIRDLSFPEDIRSSWASWPSHRDSDIDFFSTIVQSRSETIRPHVIAIYRNDQVETLLVGRIDDTPIKFTIGYLNFWTQKARVLRVVRGGLKGKLSRNNCRLLVNEVRRSLKKGEADYALFECLEVDSPMLNMAKQLPSFLFRDYSRDFRGEWIRTLPATSGQLPCVFHADCLEKRKLLDAKHCPIILSSSVQHHRWRTLLSRHKGKVSISCFCSVEDLEKMISDVEMIARKSYQRGLGVGFVDSAETRQRLHMEATKGWLRGYVLYLAGQPCAYWVGSQYGHDFYADWTGYDPDYAKFSPGSYLITRAMCEIWNHSEGAGNATIHFGIGESQWKAALSNQKREECAVRIFSATFKGAILNFSRTLPAFLNRAGNWVLKKGHLLSRAKRSWREWKRINFAH
jgi:hypothetical protein